MVSQEVAEVAAMLRLATRFFWYPLVMVRLHHVGSEWIRNLLKFPRMVPNSLKIGKGSAFNDFFSQVLKEIWIPNCENHPGLPGCPLRFHWPGVIDPAGCASCGVSLQVSQHFAAIRTTSNRITQ